MHRGQLAAVSGASCHGKERNGVRPTLMGALKIGLDSRQFFQIELADDFPAATLMGLENENRQIFKNLFVLHRKYKTVY